MLGRTKNQRYLLWLALGTATMALAMASLLVFELAQKRILDQASAMRSDSLTALAFQFEREFLRLRQSLGENLAGQESTDPESLALRYDIFLSRLRILRESPSVSLLTGRAEYRKVMADLDPLVQDLDSAMAAKPLDRKALAQVLTAFNALGIDVQAMTLAANSEVARRLEQQSDTMREQNRLIVWLTVAQLVLLISASAALVVRQKRMEAERLALEHMAQELRDAHFRAEAANRGKSQFLANMSHELRTPFNGLMGMLGLLQGTPLSAQQADYIHTAQSSASHLLTLLNDILDLSALETGKLTVKPAPLALAPLLAEVIALMHPQVKSKGLEFRVQMPPAPLPSVLADATRLKQILFNLLNNAVKFTEAGHVSLSVSELSRSDQALEIEFAIQDSGIGMDAQALSQLFQRFYQVEGSSTRRFGGTGLGLEISQSLARLMQGDIRVSSEVGVGSTFTATLRLPINPGGVEAAPAETEPVSLADRADTATQAEPATLVTASEQATVAQGLRVLVVEDHPINQKLVGVLLGRMGCQLSYCENGQLAVERVQQEPFDLILMDVNMPVMDGLAATRAIRALPGVAGTTPIVILTADVMNEAADKAVKAGANAFISKPIKAEQLRTMVLQYSAKTAGA